MKYKINKQHVSLLWKEINYCIYRNDISVSCEIEIIFLLN